VTFATKPQRMQHRRVEMELHKLLIAEPFSVPVKIQAPEGKCKLDFFFPDWRLAIEIDGPWHDPEVDKQRDEGLGKMGIAVLRLPADMPVTQMRRNIAHVSQRLLYMPLAEKLQFVRSYKPELLERLVSPPEVTSASASLGPNPLCIDCGGHGWKRIVVWSDFLGRADERSKRCACKNLRDDHTLILEPVDIPTMLRERLSRKPVQQTNLFTAESLRNRA